MLRSPGFYTGGGSVGSVGIDVYTVSGETDLLGKKASELMEGITVEGDTVTGMLNYVTGYTGFHGSDPEEQEGNYLALLFRADGYQLTASHSGGEASGQSGSPGWGRDLPSPGFRTRSDDHCTCIPGQLPAEPHT